ncbi:hypothetical protein ElyMa_002280900 [Elysia marginata]|uniref:MARVEL domain-containing protein n=1 Tax=Elysia marginata TaxID=1093978 RepID=A0AAV4G1K0_9GAST|nr:hypothetical protein ElyMa_002280900 [Elysia marginata]
MGVKDSFTGAATLVKAALLLALLANLCSWISFTTTSWIQQEGTTSTLHVGLWRLCSDSARSGCDMMDGQGDATFNAVQAFAIFGFVALNAGFVLFLLFVFWESCKGNTEASLAAAILLFVSGGCWMLAAIIFGAEYDEKYNDLHYSYALAIIAAIIAVIGGVVAILARGGSSGVSSS